MPGTPRRRWPVCSLAALALSLFVLMVALRVALGPRSAAGPNPPAGMALIGSRYGGTTPSAALTPPPNYEGSSWGISGGMTWARWGLSRAVWKLEPALDLHPVWNPLSSPRRVVWAATSGGTLTVTIKTSPTAARNYEAHWAWLLGLALALGLAPAWRVRRSLMLIRRARNNQCTACGYSRVGLGDHAPCPECGASRAPAHTT